MDANGKILCNKQIAEAIFFMSVRLPDEFNEPILPGQFSHIQIPGAKEHILRRPISVNSYQAKTKTVDYIYQVKGEGTRILSMQGENTPITLIPALGKGFSLPEEPCNVMLIGAGIGCAPLKYASEYWPQHRFTAVLGFRDSAYAYQTECYKGCGKTCICTDNGSMGEKAYVSELAQSIIKQQKPDCILACGPNVVLKLVQKLSLDYDIPCQLSLEARMGCGVGACVVCNVKIGTPDNWHYKRCCADGPVFDAKEVLFE